MWGEGGRQGTEVEVAAGTIMELVFRSEEAVNKR